MIVISGFSQVSTKTVVAQAESNAGIKIRLKNLKRNERMHTSKLHFELNSIIGN
jgi:hypothetical protein